MLLLWIALGLVALTAIQMAITHLRIAALRRSGLYPAPGRATMADVKRLVEARQSIWAIRCYREIHPQVSLKEAKRMVDKLIIAN
jgi:ribosomal protein L7/L12